MESSGHRQCLIVTGQARDESDVEGESAKDPEPTATGYLEVQLRRKVNGTS